MSRKLNHRFIDRTHSWRTPWHQHLARFGGFLFGLGFSPDAIRAALETENASEGGVMKSDDRDIEALLRWLEDVHPGNETAPLHVANPGGYVFAWKAHAGLTLGASLVLLALCNRAKLDGTVTVSMARLAEDTTMTRRTVRLSLDALEEAHAIDRTRRRKFTGHRGLSATNSYRLQSPRPAGLSVEGG